MRLLPILLTSLLLCCHKVDVDKDAPACLKEKIKTFNKESACNKDVTVKEYIFQSNSVYVFDPGTCGADMTSEVIDTDCKTLGYLGGFIGNNTINNESFANATFQKTIWEK